MTETKLILGNCIDEMARMEKESIDLTVTSPPYDNLRDYDGKTYWNENIWKETIKGLFKITKKGGVVVWVVSDSCKKGSESGTSFRQALFFKECGFNIHDTMIYNKTSNAFPPVNRYWNMFEYMFVFSKGKPKTTNILREPTNPKYRRKKKNLDTYRRKDGSMAYKKYACGNPDKKMGNVWTFSTGYMVSTPDKIAYKHPAIFPDKLAERHIVSWSKENDWILDPFMGSGTVGKMALKLNRNFIGIEISEEYLKIAEQRINTTITIQKEMRKKGMIQDMFCWEG